MQLAMNNLLGFKGRVIGSCDGCMALEIRVSNSS